MILGSGGGLLSQRVSPQVSSLLTRFTFVFGMGTGGSTSPCHQSWRSLAQPDFQRACEPFENCTVGFVKLEAIVVKPSTD